MKNKIFIIVTIFFSFLSYFSNAQEVSEKESSSKNYFISNISYANLKHSANGSAMGIAYHRMFFDKFGANTSYSRITSHELGGYHYSLPNDISHKIGAKMTSSHSMNIGLTYRTIANTSHELLAAVGFNYQYVYYNYVENDIHLADGWVNLSQVYDNFSGHGLYFSLDYLYFITKEFALGIHGAYEYSPSSFSIANAGISLAYRF